MTWSARQISNTHHIFEYVFIFRKRIAKCSVLEISTKAFPRAYSNSKGFVVCVCVILTTFSCLLLLQSNCSIYRNVTERSHEISSENILEKMFRNTCHGNNKPLFPRVFILWFCYLYLGYVRIQITHADTACCYYRYCCSYSSLK